MEALPRPTMSGWTRRTVGGDLNRVRVRVSLTLTLTGDRTLQASKDHT